jgi:hypothetical protein
VGVRNIRYGRGVIPYPYGEIIAAVAVVGFVVSVSAAIVITWTRNSKSRTNRKP